MRYLFVIGDVFVKAGTPVGGDTPALLSPNQPFTLWNQDTGGSQITDLTAKDGVSALTVDGGGNPVADPEGVPPKLRGPDGWNQPLWIDDGSGQRFPVWPYEALVQAVTAGVATVDLSGTPLEVRAPSGGGGTIDSRPATTRPVHVYAGAAPSWLQPNFDQWFPWTAQ